MEKHGGVRGKSGLSGMFHHKRIVCTRATKILCIKGLAKVEAVLPHPHDAGGQAGVGAAAARGAKKQDHLQHFAFRPQERHIALSDVHPVRDMGLRKTFACMCTYMQMQMDNVLLLVAKLRGYIFVTHFRAPYTNLRARVSRVSTSHPRNRPEVLYGSGGGRPIRSTGFGYPL